MLLPELPEFSIYSFLKINVYERAVQCAQAPSRPLVPALQAYLDRLSSRRLHTLMVAGTTDPRWQESQFTDFFDISSYFVRERMKNLNHGTVLQSIGRGLRGAVTYRWKEPLDSSTLSSFLQMRQLLGGHLSFGLDLWRIADECADEEFSQDDFVQLFRRHRARFVERRWYQLATRAGSSSPDYTRFLIGRLEKFEEGGLLTRVGQKWRISEKGKQAAHWFELFVYSAAYRNAPDSVSSKSLN